MKVQKKEFLSKLGTNLLVISENSTLPILKNVLLNASDGTLNISTTNLNVYVESSMKCEGDINVLVNAKKLKSIVESILSDTIYMNRNNDKLEITFGNMVHMLSIDESENYPEIKQYEEKDIKASIELDKIILDNIKKTLHCCSVDELKPEMNCLCINNKDNEIVATDGRRMAVLKTLFSSNLLPFILIPLQVAKVLGKYLTIKVMLNNIDDNVLIITDDDTTFIFENNTNYPNYKSIMGKTYSKSLIVNREELLKSVKSLSLSTDETKVISYKIIDKRLLHLHSENNGDNATDILCCRTEGLEEKEFKFAFNSQYMQELLLCLKDEYITLNFEENNQSFEYNNNILNYIIMPVKITETEVKAETETEVKAETETEVKAETETEVKTEKTKSKTKKKKNEKIEKIEVPQL